MQILVNYELKKKRFSTFLQALKITLTFWKLYKKP